MWAIPTGTSSTLKKKNQAKSFSIWSRTPNSVRIRQLGRTGKRGCDTSSFWFFLQRSSTSRACRPATVAVLPQTRRRTACRSTQHQPRSGPTTLNTLQLSFGLKRHHQLVPSVRMTVPLQVKTDHSVTDGINSEHKQEQRQSAKDARSVRRRRQQAS